MASSIVLKKLLASNLLSRVAVPLRPAVASGVLTKGYSTRTSLVTEKTKPHSFKREDAKSINLYVEMPGLNANDVDVTVDQRYGNDHVSLCIKGKALEKDYECECRNYYHSINLPENIKATAIEAFMEKGILKLTLPKTQEIQKDQKMINLITIKVDEP